MELELQKGSCGGGGSAGWCSVWGVQSDKFETKIQYTSKNKSWQLLRHSHYFLP